MSGKKIKQINNLVIRHTELYQYSVWSPDGRCLEDRLTLEQAEDYCKETKDFLSDKTKKSLDSVLADAYESSAKTNKGEAIKSEFVKE